MVGHGGSSAGSYLADPTSTIPSHCASIVVIRTVRVKHIASSNTALCHMTVSPFFSNHSSITIGACDNGISNYTYPHILTLTVLVTTIDALRHFETG